MKVNNYADAIRILSDDDLDHKQLVFNLAMLRPKAIVDAYNQMLRAGKKKVSLANLTGWQKEAYEMALRGEGKITVVKRVRELTSMGLKEAKEAVEEIIEESLWQRATL